MVSFIDVVWCSKNLQRLIICCGIVQFLEHFNFRQLLNIIFYYLLLSFITKLFFGDILSRACGIKLTSLFFFWLCQHSITFYEAPSSFNLRDVSTFQLELVVQVSIRIGIFRKEYIFSVTWRKSIYVGALGLYNPVCYQGGWKFC